MRKINTLLVALSLSATALLMAPSTAQASASSTSSSDSASAAAPNGYLYAWDGFKRDGDWCRWYNNDSNWDTCSGSTSNMRNRASSLENRGYAGSFEDVNLFYSPSSQGARSCLPNGLYLDNLTGIYFLWDGEPGQGQTTNNNIASHAWSNDC